jgi:hypothetical protein
MRVIDGVHRVRAAALRGASHIEVRFFDGSESAAFALAVRANIAHGLPLSLAERKAAAVRIMSSNPLWSDRKVAAATGLGRRTVSTLREGATGQASQLHSRIGLDGRVRPLSTVEGRRRAGALVRQCPDVSLREIAKATGVSVGTARDVRTRVWQGRDPVPAGRWRAPAEPAGTSGRDERTGAAPTVTDYPAIWQRLTHDPSLRLGAPGRRLLRWLGAYAARPGDHSQFVAAVPPHCADLVAELARYNARMWDGFAREVERRAGQVAVPVDEMGNSQ